MLTVADVKTKCNHWNSTLGTHTEFLSVGLTRIANFMCPDSSSSNDRLIYTAPILASTQWRQNGGKCPAFKCKCKPGSSPYSCSGESGGYACNEGFSNDPFYELFCKYIP
jgi:hypothetical protein